MLYAHAVDSTPGNNPQPQNPPPEVPGQDQTPVNIPAKSIDNFFIGSAFASPVFFMSGFL